MQALPVGFTLQQLNFFLIYLPKDPLNTVEKLWVKGPSFILSIPSDAVLHVSPLFGPVPFLGALWLLTTSAISFWCTVLATGPVTVTLSPLDAHFLLLSNSISPTFPLPLLKHFQKIL